MPLYRLAEIPPWKMLQSGPSSMNKSGSLSMEDMILETPRCGYCYS